MRVMEVRGEHTEPNRATTNADTYEGRELRAPRGRRRRDAGDASDAGGAGGAGGVGGDSGGQLRLIQGSDVRDGDVRDGDVRSNDTTGGTTRRRSQGARRPHRHVAWPLDEQTRRRGLAGVQRARAALEAVHPPEGRLPQAS